jgi:hypothetical protein
MQESHTDWLRGHMRDHVANSSMVDSADNILNFQRPPYSAKNPGAAALDLVYQAPNLSEMSIIMLPKDKLARRTLLNKQSKN